jgi:hypothetical protein
LSELMVPPLPLAREFEGCPVRRMKIAKAADFAGLLAWR